MKVFLCVFLCAIIAAKAANDATQQFYDQYKEEWDSYKEKYQKKYDTEVEDRLRMKIYVESKLFVDKHNEKYKKGEVSYSVGINQFSDMLDHEIPTGFVPSATLRPVASRVTNP